MTDQERLWQAMVHLAPTVFTLCIEQSPMLVGTQPKGNINLGLLGQLSLAGANAMLAQWKATQPQPEPEFKGILKD